MKKLLIIAIGAAALFAVGCATAPQYYCSTPQRFTWVLTQSNVVVGSYTNEASARMGAVFLRPPFRITPMLINTPATDQAGYIVLP